MFKFVLQKRINQVRKVSIYLSALKIAFPSRSKMTAVTK